MLSSLDAAYAFISSTPRNRTPRDAHRKLNQAYFELLFAWGYAQAGNEARSAELLRAARDALPVIDPVHQAVLGAFEVRIRERTPSPWTRLEVELSSLEAIERYQVMRLFEALAILSRVEVLNGIASFWHWAQGQPVTPVEDVVTRVLIADGEGRLDDVRTSLDAAFASAWVSGAVLIGPCRRAGREAQLLERLRRQQREPASVEHAALVALGATPPTALQLEQLGPHRPAQLASARRHIGALAMSGHTAAAKELAARSWREASDAYSTNAAFSLTALGVCETIVLSALRHELALGNRSLLEPTEPPPEPSPAPAVPVSSPVPEDDEDEDDDEEDDGLVVGLEMLASALRAASITAGDFERRFREHGDALGGLVHVDHEEASTDSSPLAERMETVKSLASEAMAIALEADDDAELANKARRLVLPVLALVEEFQRSEPPAPTKTRIVEALFRVGKSLRSCIVERPRMTKALFAEITHVQQALGKLGVFGVPHDDFDSWVELPLEELIGSMRALIDEAERELSSLNDQVAPAFVAAAREGVSLSRALFSRLLAEYP